MTSLWLFDIDGTLVDTGGAGLRSLQEAATECFGGPCPELDLAGSTDLGVVHGILGHFGIDSPDDHIDAFFAAYLDRLDWNLAHGGFPGRVLPGVGLLLERLADTPGVHLGLLTGNIAGGATAKMRHFGLDRYFPFGAYGCDFADRNRLGPVALQRAIAHAGRDFAPHETLVIGDTPKDIACAKAFGASCVAVATGKFNAEELSTFHPTRVVETLEALL
jgi:phosphoglycolate phosphatase-like HAD superfamily hydrolase